MILIKNKKNLVNYLITFKIAKAALQIVRLLSFLSNNENIN